MRDVRFNEARAFSAGNRTGSQEILAVRGGFNEARAFSAGNLPDRPPARFQDQGFNEARAFSAGNLRPATKWKRPGCCRFNEARAFSAGNLLRQDDDVG